MPIGLECSASFQLHLAVPRLYHFDTESRKCGRMHAPALPQKAHVTPATATFGASRKTGLCNAHVSQHSFGCHDHIFATLIFSQCPSFGKVHVLSKSLFWQCPYSFKHHVFVKPIRFGRGATTVLPRSLLCVSRTGESESEEEEQGSGSDESSD